MPDTTQWFEYREIRTTTHAPNRDLILASPPRLEPKLHELLESINRLTDGHMVMLADAWDDELPDARLRAWARAKSAIQRSGRSEQLDWARRLVADWMARNPPLHLGLRTLLNLPMARLREAAAPALLDAAAAILAADTLAVDDEELLMRPWRYVREEAALKET